LTAPVETDRLVLLTAHHDVSITSRQAKNIELTATFVKIF